MGKNISTPQNGAVANNSVDSRIAAVRDLIFSENIQQYDEQFNDVNSKIEALRKETESNLHQTTQSIEKKLADLQNLMESRFDALTKDLDKRLEKLDDTKADRRKLGKALEKIALTLQG
ncbi:hypothetical protein OD91_2389 [Lutibacter sp. Hel_I_33_5]|uniref:hypothetical protein n=1 Tax=Lutibacter sp. Hel_I_33_5 TaxID=1566289 RepID=UPI0011A9D253|nr:hypothetical protein [Lutibacter sp. Hel_I_33_5]TVZ57083.1 hypothetical protein OD91_2389 [Lutibacter sp. Hel_I_33_5]